MGWGLLQPHNHALHPRPLWGRVGTGIVPKSDGKTQWDSGWGELSMGSPA